MAAARTTGTRTPTTTTTTTISSRRRRCSRSNSTWSCCRSTDSTPDAPPPWRPSTTTTTRPSRPTRTPPCPSYRCASKAGLEARARASVISLLLYVNYCTSCFARRAVVPRDLVIRFWSGEGGGDKIILFWSGGGGGVIRLVKTPSILSGQDLSP